MECKDFMKFSGYDESRARDDNYACNNVYHFWNVDYIMIFNSIQFLLAIIGKCFSRKWLRESTLGESVRESQIVEEKAPNNVGDKDDNYQAM